MAKFNLKPEVFVTAALGVLSVAQMVLTNKKEANDKKALKAEILAELMTEKPTNDYRGGPERVFLFVYIYKGE